MAILFPTHSAADGWGGPYFASIINLVMFIFKQSFSQPSFTCLISSAINLPKMSFASSLLFNVSANKASVCRSSFIKSSSSSCLLRFFLLDVVLLDGLTSVVAAGVQWSITGAELVLGVVGADTCGGGGVVVNGFVSTLLDVGPGPLMMEVIVL